jgi:NADPH:quinone reductase-like Zn-dependent oxidoreductase
MDLPTTMHAVLLTGHGDTDRLDYRTDVPVPLPRASDVLLRVGAAGVNNTDINTRIGWYGSGGAEAADGNWGGGAQRLPCIQGADVCGRIVALGEGVDAARLGERVLVQSCLRSLAQDRRDVWLGSDIDGGFAQFVRVPAADCHRIDSDLSDAALASFPCAYGTAENLMTRADVVAGERVLITGASGGVGSAAIQLAARRGAHVIAVAAHEKRDACIALGAREVIARGTPLLDALGASNVDAVIDVVGGAAWPALLDVLRPRGRYAVSGAIAGPNVSLDLRTLYLKDLTLYGCTSQGRAAFEALVGYIERKEVRPVVARTYALSELAQAQRDFVAKLHVGKLVVIPPQPAPM